MKAIEANQGLPVTYEGQRAILVCCQLNHVIIDVDGKEIAVSYDKVTIKHK